MLPVVPLNLGTIALSGIAAIVLLALTLSPESLVSFGTVGMLFATPVAVIINTIMARHDASKAASLAVDVANKASEAAELLRKSQESAAAKAAEAASLLLESNKVVAKNAEIQGAKLDQIHTLVNSNLTAAMESELGAHKTSLVLMLEMNDLKKAAGKPPSEELIGAVEAIKIKIAEMDAQLRDRLKQTDIAARKVATEESRPVQ